MICKACAFGADLITEYLSDPFPFEMPVEMVDAAGHHHEKCKGCDCQHRAAAQIEGKSIRK